MPGMYVTLSLESPAATIGHTIASFHTWKSISTGRSLIWFALRMHSMASSFVRARMATHP